LVPKQNPAWVTKHLADSWVTLESKVPAKWMPKLDMTVAKGKRLTGEIPEYGCGAYGCVLPTLDDKIVLKLTTDDTEAQFAARLAKQLPVPIVTNYELVFHLPTAKRQGRAVYLLWREAADDVGNVDKVVGPHAEDAIAVQHRAAQEAFDKLAHGEPAERELAAWVSAVKGMGKVPELRWLADGMLAAYEQKGIFFGDIHGGNMGRARGQWVITDPGHVAVVKRDTPRKNGLPPSSPDTLTEAAQEFLQKPSRELGKYVLRLADQYLMAGGPPYEDEVNAIAEEVVGLLRDPNHPHPWLTDWANPETEL